MIIVDSTTDERIQNVGLKRQAFNGQVNRKADMTRHRILSDTLIIDLTRREGKDDDYFITRATMTCTVDTNERGPTPFSQAKTALREGSCH